jgi:hypothetical protein
MDGAPRLRPQMLPIRRRFEESRLEQDLVASAYEQAVPFLRQPSVPRKIIDSSREALDEQQLTAIGG